MRRSDIRFKFVCLLFIILAPFIFVYTAVAQKSRIVESIDVSGNRRLKDADILKHVKTKIGEPYTDNQLELDLKAIINLGLFDESSSRVFLEESRHGNTAVIFEVRELPMIVALEIEGLRKVSSEELLTELEKKGAKIAVGMPYRPWQLKKARKIIGQYLGERGVEVTEIQFTDYRRGNFGNIRENKNCYQSQIRRAIYPYQIKTRWFDYL
jgi:outer membrane protein assembly factor BamA